MGYSSLATQIKPPKHSKWSSRGGAKIGRVIVHHWAGTAGGVERLVESTDKASVHYIILSDGAIIGSVDEAYRAWTSGSSAADSPSITVEVQNAETKNYTVTAKALASLVALIADVATRYGFTPSRETVRGHREFSSTACPGPYLWPLINSGSLATRALAAMGGSSASATTTTTTTTTTVTASSTEWPHVDLLVDGSFGAKSVKALQRLLKGIKKYTGLIDGSFGPVSVKALQTWLKGLGFYRGLIDGDWGKVTTKALQTFLKSKGLYTGLIDGQFGPLTIKALQTYLNDQARYFN